MKFAILQCVNGNFSIKSEWTDLEKAKVNYHSVCASLWNAADVLTATVCIIDEALIVQMGYKEYVVHEKKPEEEPVETEKDDFS